MKNVTTVHLIPIRHIIMIITFNRCRNEIGVRENIGKEEGNLLEKSIALYDGNL